MTAYLLLGAMLPVPPALTEVLLYIFRYARVVIPGGMSLWTPHFLPMLHPVCNHVLCLCIHMACRDTMVGAVCNRIRALSLSREAKLVPTQSPRARILSL